MKNNPSDIEHELKADFIKELLNQANIEERIKRLKGLAQKISDPNEIVEILRELFLHETNGEVIYFGVQILENEKMKAVPGAKEVVYEKLDRDANDRYKGHIEKHMVHIGAGQFNMGRAGNKMKRRGDKIEMQHKVKVSKFLMNKFLVTNSLYEKFDPNHERCKESNEDNQPVINVNWFEASMFCRYFGCRLPTEAEWEYACRAGTKTPFNSGDFLTRSDANYDQNFFEGKTTPVFNYPPNNWGIHDMHGNVFDWCNDWYKEDYYKECKDQGVVEDPKGPKNGSERVLRGGTWCSFERDCSSAYRCSSNPEVCNFDTGFRLVSVC